MASGEREPHLRNLLAPHQLLEAFCRTWDPNFDTERPDLTALIGRLDRTHGRDGKKINSDLYACRHAMDLRALCRPSFLLALFRVDDLVLLVVEDCASSLSQREATD